MDTLIFATDLAKKAGALLLNYYQPKGIHADLKSDSTVVTEADLAADQLIRESIEQAYPDDGIISEEAGTIFPQGKSDVWIVDPLDGTTNFSLGIQHWGIALSRITDGYPDLGVLYFPLLDELYTAEKGGGASLNGTQLTVKVSDASQPMSFFLCCSRTFRHYDVSVRYKTRILGSAAYGLCTVARGSARLAFEVTPKVWDFSASWLITQEAGGFIAPLNGDSPFPLIPGIDYEKLSYPMLAAASQEMWEEGRQQIIPKEI